MTGPGLPRHPGVKNGVTNGPESTEELSALCSEKYSRRICTDVAKCILWQPEVSLIFGDAEQSGLSVPTAVVPCVPWADAKVQVLYGDLSHEQLNQLRAVIPAKGVNKIFSIY